MGRGSVAVRRGSLARWVLYDLLPPPPWGLGILAKLPKGDPMDGPIDYFAQKHPQTAQRSEGAAARALGGHGPRGSGRGGTPAPSPKETSVPPRAAP